MVNFKIGDRVKCINAEVGQSIFFGKYYTIARIKYLDHDWYVSVEEVDNGSNGYYRWRFKKDEITLDKGINIL